MTFPKLTSREILGLFDEKYDLFEVTKDIRQIITDDLGLRNAERSPLNENRVPKNIYLEELAVASARSFGQIKEEKHVESLDTLDKFVYIQMLGSKSNARVQANISSEGDSLLETSYVKPTNFINEFLVPKVEELVDFITLKDLEKLIENYSLSVKSLDYFYLTTYEKPSETKLPFNSTRRVGDTLSGVYRIGRNFVNSEGQEIKGKFGNSSSKFIQDRSTYRGGVDLSALTTPPPVSVNGNGSISTPIGFSKIPVYTAYFDATLDIFNQSSRRSIFLNKRSNTIILEPENTGSFSDTNPKNTTGQLNLSKKYAAAPSVNFREPFYNQDSIPFINLEDTKTVINKIKSIEKRIPEFSNTYSSLELAKIIMARWALRTLADQIRQVRQQIKISDDDAAVVTLSEEILDAIKRERIADPDFNAYNSQTTEALSNLVQRRVEISPQCYLINNIIEAAKLNRLRLNMSQPAVGPTADIRYEKVRIVSDSGKNSAALINKLTVNKGQSKMLELRPTDISNLYPYLRIYKTVFDQQGRVEKEAEFKFPNLTNVQSTNKAMEVIGNVTNQYTQEYGITSFNWNFVGSDPFSYANDIDATLSLHFNDFEQLVLERKTIYDGEEVRYRLLDLISISEKELKELNKLGSGSPLPKTDFKYDIRVDVGWNGPNSEKVRGFSAEDSIRTFYLAMTDYDIGFNQEGFFELIINYKARLEQAMYDRRTNILQPPKSEKKEIERLQKEISDLKAGNEGNQNKNIGLIRSLEDRVTTLQFDLKSDTLSNVVTFLIENGSIFSETVTPAQMFGYEAENVNLQDNRITTPSQNSGAFESLKSVINLDVTSPSLGLFDFANAAFLGSKLYSKATFDEAEAKNQRMLNISEEQLRFIPKKENGKYILNFFFLGDLIESLCRNVFKEDASRTPAEQDFINDIRVITTDFLIYDPKNLESKTLNKVNISDIPISVDLFSSFYFEKVIKYNVTRYSLMKFIKDVISYCILNIFEECFGEDNLVSSINTAFADFSKTPGGNDPFDMTIANKDKPLKFGGKPLGQNYESKSSITKVHMDLSASNVSIPKISRKKDRKDCVHSLIIYTDAFDVQELKINPGSYNKKREEDNKIGLYHLDIGSIKGILKKINFSKTDQRYLREQRFTQDVAKGFAILSNVFDVDIELVGNTLFFPGQRVFLNLGERFSALGKPYDKGFSFAKVMGMGGYHLITSVENEISPDGFSTKIKARWETSGDGDNKDVNKGVSVSSPLSQGSIKLSEPQGTQ